MAKITGGCLCGKVRYSANADPAFIGVCHCRDCQKFTGSAFAMVVACRRRRCQSQGKLNTFSKPGDTGKTIERSFCPECGSSIADEAAVMPGMRDDQRRYAGRSELGEAGDADLLRQRAALGGTRRWIAELPENAGLIIAGTPSAARPDATNAPAITTIHGGIAQSVERQEGA